MSCHKIILDSTTQLIFVYYLTRICPKTTGYYYRNLNSYERADLHKLIVINNNNFKLQIRRLDDLMMHPEREL